MQPDLWKLYRQMLRSRLYEEAVRELWEEGLISGEMHMGLGEEAIVAGVLDHVRDGDALALDHRGTAPMLLRGIDPVILLREMLGLEDGLCRGMGGHMHLFSREHLAASSGIVGAAGPAAAGFALAAQQLRPQSLAVAFFGEGATNQGMLLESFNLAVIWRLPVLFVCKDDRMAITTEASMAIGGDLLRRAEGFGLPATSTDGSDVGAVWNAAAEAAARARAGEGPTFLHFRCRHLEGHFLGDPLLRIARHPVKEMADMTGPSLRAATRRRGASPRERAAGLRTILGLAASAFRRQSDEQGDPLPAARQRLLHDDARLTQLEADVVTEIETVVRQAVTNQVRDEPS
jgi:pyruvate dehydrogenase E1 component alpha subunit